MSGENCEKSSEVEVGNIFFYCLNSDSVSFKRASIFKCNCIIVCTIISEFYIYWSRICGESLRTM